jgi:hypothetical protein
MNKISVLLFKQGDLWAAQCLQYDIAAQGKTIRAAQRAFEFALIAEVGYAHERNRSLDQLPAAPTCYWQKFEEAARLEEDGDTEPLRVPSEVASLLPPQREHRVM